MKRAQPAASAEKAGEYRVAATEQPAPSQMAATGVRQRALTWRQMPHPGNPPSRAKAKIIRDAEVSPASAQMKLATTMAIARKSFNQDGARRVLDRMKQERHAPPR